VKSELIKAAFTSMVNETYYEKSDDLVKRLDDLVSRLPDKDFALKLAIYARDNGLRSINHLIIALYIQHAK